MTIRKASLLDINNIQSLYIEIKDDLLRYQQNEAGEIEVDPNNDWWIRPFLESDEFPVFVACNDQNEVIGYIVAYDMHLINEEYTELWNMYISNIGVKKEYRSSGIGNALLQKVEEYARDNKYRAIFLDVYIDNEKARSLYEKNEYKIVRESRRKYLY